MDVLGFIDSWGSRNSMYWLVAHHCVVHLDKHLYNHCFEWHSNVLQRDSISKKKFVTFCMQQ